MTVAHKSTFKYCGRQAIKQQILEHMRTEHDTADIFVADNYAQERRGAPADEYFYRDVAQMDAFTVKSKTLSKTV